MAEVEMKEVQQVEKKPLEVKNKKK
jgi:hypothetical protein